MQPDPSRPALLVAVCVVAELAPEPDNRTGVTAIDKRPVDGAVQVGALGLADDRVGDVDHHGGPDKAVYAYAEEDAARWAADLGRDVPPGLFGENLRLRGVDVSGAVVGERWAVGDEVVLEVTQPRIPCATFQRRLGEPRWVRRFAGSGLPGAYLRVVRTGRVRAGDAVRVLHRPRHGVSVGTWASAPSAELAARLLEAERRGEVALAPALRTYVDRAAARG